MNSKGEYNGQRVPRIRLEIEEKKKDKEGKEGLGMDGMNADYDQMSKEEEGMIREEKARKAKGKGQGRKDCSK